MSLSWKAHRCPVVEPRTQLLGQGVQALWSGEQAEKFTMLVGTSTPYGRRCEVVQEREVGACIGWPCWARAPTRRDIGQRSGSGGSGGSLHRPDPSDLYSRT